GGDAAPQVERHEDHGGRDQDERAAANEEPTRRAAGLGQTVAPIDAQRRQVGALGVEAGIHSGNVNTLLLSPPWRKIPRFVSAALGRPPPISIVWHRCSRPTAGSTRSRRGGWPRGAIWRSGCGGVNQSCSWRSWGGPAWASCSSIPGS